jgi:MipA family protein
MSLFRRFLLASLCLAPLPALADPTWRVDVGAAMIVSPRYQGADDSRVQALPYLEAAYKDLLLATVRNGRARLDITPLRANGFYAGAEASVLFGQDETDARLPGFGDVPATADIGLIAGYEVRTFQVEGRVRQALSGHDGLTAELSAALRFPVPGTIGDGKRPTIVSIGPSLDYGSGRYARSYFGIDAPRARALALPLYTPDNAWSYGGSVQVIQPVWRSLTLVAIGSVNRLTGDAARSPIVARKTNVSGIAALAWRFQSDD